MRKQYQPIGGMKLRMSCLGSIFHHPWLT